MPLHAVMIWNTVWLGLIEKGYKFPLLYISIPIYYDTPLYIHNV